MRARLLGELLCALVVLTSPLGCGSTNERLGRAGAVDVDSSGDNGGGDSGADNRVPAELLKPGISRYFLVSDTLKGLELVVFEDPDAPRVLSLGDPTSYWDSLPLTRWSPSGRRLAYWLTATRVDVEPPNQLRLVDAATDFATRLIEHPNLRDFGYQLAWVGDRAIIVVTGTRIDIPDASGFQARYSWVDFDSGAVTDLGELPPAVADDDNGSTQDPASVTLQATPSGVLYVDRDCNLVYLERPGHKQELLNDCTAQAEWSGDGSFAFITSSTERALYELVDGQLRRAAEISAELTSFPAAHFRWAPHAPRFLLSEGGEDITNDDNYLSRLAYGDAKTGQLVSFTSLPRVNYARLINDDLLIASDWSGEKYVSNVSSIQPNEQIELLPLDLSDHPDATLVTSSDSSRIYSLQDPFIEIELTAGTPTSRKTLFDEVNPVDNVKFRLLQTDHAGLLTMVEPRQGSFSLTYDPTHQYLLSLGTERAVIPLGSFDNAVGTNAQGIRTFQSAPQFGGIFYLGTATNGYYVDWLGFDDISRKVRIIEFQSSFIGLNFPDSVALPTDANASNQ